MPNLTRMINDFARWWGQWLKRLMRWQETGHQKSSRCLTGQLTSQQTSLQVNGDKNVVAKAAWTDLQLQWKCKISLIFTTNKARTQASINHQLEQPCDTAHDSTGWHMTYHRGPVTLLATFQMSPNLWLQECQDNMLPKCWQHFQLSALFDVQQWCGKWLFGGHLPRGFDPQPLLYVVFCNFVCKMSVTWQAEFFDVHILTKLLTHYTFS